MKRRSVVTLACALIALAAFSVTQRASGQSKDGWVTLFDGKTIDNFTQVGNANWHVEDGLIVADTGNGFLMTKDNYTDYIVRVEFWIAPETNSGVYIRCTDPVKIDSKTSYEVNIWDTRPEQDYATGAIVGLSKVNPMPKAGGKWNVYEITAKGSSLTAVLNGQKTAEANDSKFPSGHIALQHGLGLNNSDKGVVKFRKIEIKKL
jgi:hypothetical protein